MGCILIYPCEIASAEERRFAMTSKKRSSTWDQNGPIIADNDHATLLQFEEQLLVRLNLSVVLIYLLHQFIQLLLILLIPGLVLIYDLLHLLNLGLGSGLCRPRRRSAGARWTIGDGQGILVGKGIGTNGEHGEADHPSHDKCCDQC